MAANPSHLEAIDPVLEGITRARQEELGAGSDDLVLPLLLHGDAAFSGQGVVAETLNLSQLAGYSTGGTIHVVVNNQVGFTTAAVDARSSFYATDVAKGVQAPIFHVNGDDPEAVLRIARIALAFREAFHKDVVIDLVCYRRLGHNEGDEPSYTQPKMYRLVDARSPIRQIYAERLIDTGEADAEEVEGLAAAYRSRLEAALEESRTFATATRQARGASTAPVATRVGVEELDGIEARHRRPARGVHGAPEAVQAARRAPQPVRRGPGGLGAGRGARLRARCRSRGCGSGWPARTRSGARSPTATPCWSTTRPRRSTPRSSTSIPTRPRSRSTTACCPSSPPSGFEYGYSVAAPEALVIWEAQFGDFVNGAQVVIDQFLVSGLDKWDETCGLVLLLPHGFEGQGPEHSSARLERFLQNAADDNMRVAVPSTPAQYFHLLRLQALHPEKRPLVVMSPKSLLRTRESFSPVTDLAEHDYRPVLADDTVRSGARRVLLCSGKVYYDLERHRRQHEVDDVAIVRVEQLYPFPSRPSAEVLAPYGDVELVWVQEEPANMGAWRYLSRTLLVETGRQVRGLYRRASASPATGNPRTHAREQREIVEKAFT